MYCIYRTTNLVNGKTYIGQHKYKKLNDKYIGSGLHLKRAIEKYGMENFKKDILVFGIIKKNFIDLLEKEYIKFYRSIGKAEYNIADGGQGGSINKGMHWKLSEETKKKISEANKGRKMSEEWRRKNSEAHKGKKREPLSDEHKKKISESHKGYHHSDEARKKMSEACKGRSAWNKGKHLSDEARKAMHWFNNGEISIRTKECPEGFVSGRIYKRR